MHLVHFKSRDLSRIHRQGQFWHIFFTHGGVIISQDEVDTWTTHLPVRLDFDQSSIDAREQIYKVLGGQGPPFEIDIDEILVSSVWRPNNAIADRYRSLGGRAFIAGDAGKIFTLGMSDTANVNTNSAPEHSYRGIWNEHWAGRCV